MKFTNEEERYTALCAYVLGEAGDDERAAIEAELAESAELRAQRDELEATIGLVRTSLGGDETLSPGAHDEVLRAAQARRPRWQVLRTPWLAAAAGICAVAFGWYVLGGGREAAIGRLPAPDEQLAKATSETGARRGLVAGGKDALGEVADGPVLRDELAAGLELEGRADELSARQAREGEAGSTLRFGDVDGAEVAPGAPEPGEEFQYDFKREKLAPAAATRFEKVADRTQLLPSTARSAGEPVPSDAELMQELWSLGSSGEAADDASGVQLGFDRSVRQVQSSGNVMVVQGEGQKDETPNEVIAIGGGAGGRYGDRMAGKQAAGAAGQAPPASAAPSARYRYSKAHKEAEAGEVLAGLGYAGEEELSPPADERSERIQTLAEVGYAGEDAYDDEHDSDAFFIGRGEARPRQPLTPEEREKAIEVECFRIFERCRRRPNEQPSAMYFRYWGDNPFELTALDAQSTFGVDVDTASYALVRNYLRQGAIPPREAVRTEEFVNWFAPDVPAPTEGTFAIKSELAPSRFGGDASRWMLEVAVRGREVARGERKPLSLTFVVDTSGSMKEGAGSAGGRRIDMVKHALRLLLAELDGNDTVAIVAFSNEARLLLPATPAAQRGLIESAIHPLEPDGSTNAEAGLLMGYEAALAGLRANASNRVVFLSDGVANVGQTDQDRITAEVARHREQGIYLNTIGVGMSNHNDVLLEQLANRGDGICNYIDSPAEARRALVENFTGQFEPIARDVKVQVEFDPQQVHRWRLLGYENRAIADRDFRNDAVDAGELGSGHQVVALYEIERTMVAADAPIATVRLRWKPPYVAGMGKAALEAGEEASEIEQAVFTRGTSWEGASDGYKRAVLVAQFAEILRRSSHARGDSLDALLRDIELLAFDGDEDVRELFDLVRQSRELILRSLPDCDDLCLTIDEIRRWNLRQAELELLRVERDQKEIEDLARRNAELEQRIRDLVRRKYETR